ncbi:MAG: hypothetical protein PHR35_16190 [Kiritimatiellae bacterium]|nr:hypothetical protein [Kiritimatiellia bacterium]
MQKMLWGLIGGGWLAFGGWQLGAGELPAGVPATVAEVKTNGPEMTVEAVDLAGLKMATDDAIQGKPFTLEPDFVANWKGRVVWAGHGLNTYLTDARGPDADTAEYLVGDGPPEVTFRWELGSPSPAGRELKEIRLWWSLSDGARNGLHVKFSVHDAAGKEWKEITPYYRIDGAAAQFNHFKVLKLRFPAGAVANFDALRMISGETVIKLYHPRLLELDVLTGPVIGQTDQPVK